VTVDFIEGHDVIFFAIFWTGQSEPLRLSRKAGHCVLKERNFFAIRDDTEERTITNVDHLRPEVEF